MAFSYSENLANFEQWTFRQSSFDDYSSWMSSSIQETETLTKALQQSFSSDYSSEEALVPLTQFIIKPEQQPIPTTTTTATPTVSGSDPETTSKQQQQQQQQQQRRRNNHHQQTLKGKISKRKSRATNRSPITFITADPINFRQMVQQVTGIRIGGGEEEEGNLHMPVMKPEPKRRPGDLMLINGGYTLPTLDTSAFLLEKQQQQQQQQQQLMGGSTTSSTVTSPTHVSYHHATAPQVVAQVNSTSFDFDTFQSFPTLESWGVI